MPFNHYNPNNPVSLGNEFAPVVATDYTPELFVERGYSFRQDTIGSQYRWLSMFVSEMPAWPVPGHGFLFTLYRRGQEANTGPMQKILVPLSATTSANVTAVNGTVTAALANPTDNSYVRFGTANGVETYVRAGFDTSGVLYTAALTGKRIVNVSVVFSAFAEPGNEAPLPINVYHRRNSDGVRINMGTITVPLTASSILATQRHNLGELNSYELNVGLPDNPLTQVNFRLPWRYDGLGLRDFRSAGDQRIEFQIPSTTVEGLREIYLQYMALEVTYCEENRQGVIGFIRGADYTASCSFNPNGYHLGRNTFCGSLGMVDPQDPTVIATLDTYQGTVTVKRADYGPYNNAGAPGKLRGLRTIDPFPDHPGVTVTLTGAEGEIPVVATTDLVPQIIMHNPAGPAFAFADDPSYQWGHTYGLQTPLDVYAGHSVVQELDQYAAAPNTLYTRLRFWARSLDASSPLIIQRETQAQPAVSIIYTLTHDEWLTFPEVADGWRQVDLTLASTAVLVVDDDGTVLTPAAPRFRSDTAQFKPWQILAERVDIVPFDSVNPDDTGIGTYGDEDAQGGVEGAFDTTDDTDVAVVWSVEPPEPVNVVATVATQDLEHLDPTCPGEASQIPTGLQYIHLTWDVVTDGGVEFAAFDHYLVRRANIVVATGDLGEFHPIARLYSPLLNEFDDYEYDSGRNNIYRVTVVDKNGIEGGFEFFGESITGPQPTTVNDNGGECNALTITSNVNPDMNLAYPMSWPSAPAVKEFTFLEAEERVLQRFHRRNYSVAFRPAERGGVQFTRTLLTNSAQVTEFVVDKRFVPLRDTAWADLPYLCVRDQHKNRWFANVNVPSGAVQNGEKLQLAEVVVTEVTDVPYPVDVHLCEGLSSNGALPGVVYDNRYAYAAADTDGFEGFSTLEVYAGLRLPFFDQQVVPLAARYDGVNGLVFYFDDGTLGFRIVNGANDAAFTSDPVPYVPGDMFYGRMEYTATGATSTLQFSTAPDVNGAPGAFTNLTTTTVANDSIDPRFVGFPLTVGAIADGTVDFLGGATGGAGGWTGVIREMHYIVDGTERAAPQFDDEEPGTITFIEGFNEWSVTGGICEAGDQG